MHDNLDLQELQERIDHYKSKYRGIRNQTVVAFIGSFIILFFIWFQPDATSNSQTFKDFVNVWNLSIAFSPLIVIIILLFVWLAPRQKVTKERSQRAQKYLTQFLTHDDTDDVDEMSTQPKKKDRDNVLLILIFATIFASAGSASWVFIYLLLSLIPFYLLIKFPIRGWQVKNITAHEKTLLMQDIRGRVGFWLGMLVLNFFIVVGLDQFTNYLQYTFYMDTVLMVTALITLFVIELYIFNMWYNRAYYFHPLRNGRYDDLLDVINLHTKMEGHKLPFWEAIIRQLKGDSAEAESLWRDVLEMSKDNANIQTVSVALNNIGYTLIAQDRADEALTYFEASIRLYPDFPTLYQGLMGCYSELNIAPERALELGHFMMSLGHKPRFNLGFAFSDWSNTLSAMAVAYANIGNMIESRAYMTQAFEIGDAHFKSYRADLHNIAGYIESVDSNFDVARQHYEQALQIDPNGVTAKTARKYLVRLAS